MQLTSAGVDTPIKPCHANLYHGDGEKDDYVMLTMVTKWENWITSIMMEKPEHPWPSKLPWLAPLLSQKPPENCCMCIFLPFIVCFLQHLNGPACLYCCRQYSLSRLVADVQVSIEPVEVQGYPA